MRINAPVRGCVVAAAFAAKESAPTMFDETRAAAMDGAG